MTRRSSFPVARAGAGRLAGAEFDPTPHGVLAPLASEDPRWPLHFSSALRADRLVDVHEGSSE